MNIELNIEWAWDNMGYAHCVGIAHLGHISHQYLVVAVIFVGNDEKVSAHRYLIETASAKLIRYL